MIHFNAVIKKFNEQGEKTGWTYIEIPEEIASKIKPGYKKSFRVKGHWIIMQLNAQACCQWAAEVLSFQ